MTPWHPQKLVPPMCFQSLVGCLRPTIHFETLRKDPEWVFQFVKDKISSLNEDKYVHTAKFSPCELKNVVGIFAQSQGQMLASSSLSEPESTLEAPTSKDALG